MQVQLWNIQYFCLIGLLYTPYFLKFAEYVVVGLLLIYEPLNMLYNYFGHCCPLHISDYI